MSITVLPGSKKTGLLPDFLKCGLLERAVARPPNMDVIDDSKGVNQNNFSYRKNPQ